MVIGCKENKKDNGSLYIDKDYDFVLGFLVPDEDRLTNTEIFVGKMLDKEPVLLDIKGVQDTFLLNQLLSYQNWYRTVFDYHTDARVYIKSKDQNVELQHISYGTYIDLNNDLHVRQLEKYWLEVHLSDSILLTDTVIVPEDFNLLNFSNGDTVICYPKKETPTSPICWHLYPILHSVPQQTLLYRHKQTNDGPSAIEIYYYASFSVNQAAPAQYEECSTRTFEQFIWEILALDTSATIFYRSEGIAANKDVFDFLDYYNLGNIEKRNGLITHGNTNAIGNLGAYNALRFSFTVRALRDSCSCD